MNNQQAGSSGQQVNFSGSFSQRLTLLTGSEVTGALERSRVIVFGLGGVGSWCAEALVRSGLGSISLVDPDKVCISNINRQIQATSSTVGLLKAEEMGKRLRDINPSCDIKVFSGSFSRETADLFEISEVDFVIDAIDTMPHKLDLIETAHNSGRRLFSSMGMARKLDPTLVRTADIWDTSGCPLARLVREGLRKRNFSGHFIAVYSPERLPRPPITEDDNGFTTDSVDGSTDGFTEWSSDRRAMGSAVTVTAAAGMTLASLVIRDVYDRFTPPGELGREEHHG